MRFGEERFGDLGGRRELPVGGGGEGEGEGEDVVDELGGEFAGEKDVEEGEGLRQS